MCSCRMLIVRVKDEYILAKLVYIMHCITDEVVTAQNENGTDIEKKLADASATYRAPTENGKLKRQIKNKHAQMISIGKGVRIS